MSDSSSSHSTRKVRCPRCGLMIEYSTTNPYRPFCSERCKLIDLGQWANEDYKVPVQQVPGLEDLPDPSSSEDFDS